MFAVHRTLHESWADRMDPGHWHPAYEAMLERVRLPLAPLGDYIVHITYGPIVTGTKPHPPQEGQSAVAIIHQGQVAPTGTDLRGATVVAAGSAWDREDARVQVGDIVLPRSGVASVARNRCALMVEEHSAVVGSFVDLVRVRGVDPAYILLCLKTELVWAQIHRLINGVGTPNISFDEVRSLRVPVVSEDSQLDFRRRYLQNVHLLHLRWLSGDQAAGDGAWRALQELAASLNRMAVTPNDRESSLP